ncbi:MAG: iron-containing alcohol dehydrogenase [Anaerolineaceae bacterium]|nr:MAG: iron-containing alcohol dehydrogenase [Anaerolineaceae bacterium]
MDVYKIKMPPVIYGGEGSICKINEIIEKEKIKDIIIFTDQGIKSTGLLDSLLDELDQGDIAFKVFDNLATEPSYIDIENLMNKVNGMKGDLIIGIGGGSVLDTAKLVSMLINATYTVKDLLEDPTQATKFVPTVMIPTTCGTGSEATGNAIVLVPEKELKIGIVNDKMIPNYVILDPNMIRKLPKHLLASTGIDALSHAIECFTSNKATPFSDTYALHSAKLIFNNILEAYNNPDNIEAKNNMMLGAFYGGVAIAGSGTTAVHALSYPLGGKYHIPHGVSNAILIAPVMEFNKDACEDRLAVIYDAVCNDGHLKSETEKAQYIIDKIEEIVRVTEIPTDLSEFGVKPEDIGYLVESASKVTRLLSNNIKELSLEDIRNIYKKVL